MADFITNNEKDTTGFGLALNEVLARRGLYFNPRSKRYERIGKNASNANESLGDIKPKDPQIACGADLFREYPLQTLDVGDTKYSLPSSITKQSIKYASLGDIWKGTPDEGSEQGAFRHMLWQSAIASKHGKDFAKKVGNCHEKNEPFDSNQFVFDNLGSADRNIDYRNNQLARDIGTRNPKKSMKDLIPIILDEWERNGFWGLNAQSDRFYAVKRRMLPERLNRYRRFLDELNK